EHGSEPLPAETPSDEPEPEDRQKVEGDRGEVRRRQGVPLPAPAEDEVAGDVRLVRDRAVRVAFRIRALAAAVRLHPVADLAGRVGLAARLERLAARQLLDREVPPRRLPLDD